MTRYYEKADMMVAREIANEMILVPIRHNVGDLQCMYTLNGVGKRIWQLINGGSTIDDIVTVLTQEYEVEAEQAESDVIEFLSQMKDIGAIVERTEGV